MGIGRGMAQELSTDYLVVARQKDPPPEVTLIRALSSAGLGMAVYAPAGARSPTAPASRERIGSYTLAAPKLAAQARISVYRWLGPVTAGMGEAAFERLTRGLRPAEVEIAREGTLAYDLRLNCSERDAAQALAWGIHVLRTVLETVDAVVIDPAAQRCSGKAELARLPLHTPLAHIVLHNEGSDAEYRWLHTHGLQKFGRPELELLEVPVALQEDGVAFLRDLAAQLAGGGRLAAGQEVQVEGARPMVAMSAPGDLDHQAEHGRLRLVELPAPGERQGMGAGRFLASLALADAERQMAAGDRAGASQLIARVLAAAPDDCAALALEAHLLLQMGQAGEALAVGELLDLRAPADYRGPLAQGAALSALGRYREALHVLTRAISRSPDAAEAFDLRAEVNTRLGQAESAAADRARAAYLRR